MNVPSLSETSLPKIVQGIRDLAAGRSNAVASAVFDLVEGAQETVVTDALCADSSMPVLVPVSGGAAASGWFVKDVGPGAFVVGHATAPSGARFRYELRRN